MPFFLLPLIGSVTTALAAQEVGMFVAGATAAHRIFHD